MWGRKPVPGDCLVGFPGGSDGKESTCNVGDLSSIPGLRRYPGEGKGYTHSSYSGLENSMDYRVAKSWTGLSDFHSPFFFVIVAGSLLILLIFSKSLLSVFSLFIYFSYFQIHWLLLFISFLMLAFSILIEFLFFFVLVFFKLYGIVFFFKIH